VGALVEKLFAPEGAPLFTARPVFSHYEITHTLTMPKRRKDSGSATKEEGRKVGRPSKRYTIEDAVKMVSFCVGTTIFVLTW
jgi:hypothetical protein